MFRRFDRLDLTHLGLSLTPLTWRLASDVEESLVDSTTEGRQDDNKSNQGSPVSVKDIPGEAAPFKWEWGDMWERF